MDITAIIKDNLPDGVELGDKAIKTIEKEIRQQQGLEFVPKDQYNKKVSIIDDMKSEMEGMMGKSADLDAYKDKVATLEEEYKNYKATKDKEFADYKTGIETEKITSTKQTALRKHLIDSGAADDDLILDSLQGKFDLTKLEFGEDGKTFKDWEATFNPVKEQYAKHFMDQQQAQEQSQQQYTLPNGVKLMQTDNQAAAGSGNTDPFLAGFNEK